MHGLVGDTVQAMIGWEKGMFMCLNESDMQQANSQETVITTTE